MKRSTSEGQSLNKPASEDHALKKSASEDQNMKTSQSAMTKITNLMFVGDVLLFSRGDHRSVELLVNAFKNFSMSTSMKVNPSKCKIYFGGVDDCWYDAALEFQPLELCWEIAAYQKYLLCHH
ncbi:hypothetical protein KIW84_052671 [Lathyrus oleraceus]|uniref:Reverse transcriptase n=1 Tax=Pisum sativum TaxID=3888 RepID=A0A9D4WN93_PEA|nr:hypothetical protein KIW84_052671 [Pisum sativum]